MPLNQLDTAALSKIITNFGNQGKIFQSEAQFQFDLAWELKSIYNCTVKLEEMTAYKVNNNGKTVQKFYTDIVLEDTDYRVALELKYKTADYYDQNNNIILFDHSAIPLGRYDYLWDVHRIELVTGIAPAANNVTVPGQRKCNKGFAVLLTNESQYWDKQYISNVNKNKVNKVTIDNQFRIGNQTPMLYSTYLDWVPGNNGSYPPGTVNGTDRAQPIILNTAYYYKWEPYLNNNQQTNGKFNFVIIEIP